MRGGIRMNKQTAKLWAEYKAWLKESQKETVAKNEAFYEEWKREHDKKVVEYEEKLAAYEKAEEDEKQAIKDWDNLGYLCKIGTTRPTRNHYRRSPRYPFTSWPIVLSIEQPTVEGFLDWLAVKYKYG